MPGGVALRRGSVGVAVLALFLSTTGVGTAGPTKQRMLSASQVHRIVRTTHFGGLRSHQFRIAGSFTTGRPRTVVLRLDEARVGVSLAGLRNDIAVASSLAAGRPSFTSDLTFGPGRRQRVTFFLAPAGVLDPRAPYIRYLVFSPRGEPLGNLTRPRRVPPVDALTVLDPYDRINVTLLRDQARGATWGPGVPAAQLSAMVECLNTTSFLYVKPKTIDRLRRHHVDPNQVVALGREIWSNSLGFAITSARQGTSYRTYVRQVRRLHFNLYRRNDLRYLTVSADQYRGFARS